MMMRAVRNPAVKPASEVKLADKEMVIGVVVEGKARAYRRDGLKSMFRHVVDDVVKKVPVSVTYCDRDGCIRVFTADHRGKVLELDQMGFDDGLLLLLEGVAYKQKTGQPRDPESDASKLQTLSHTLTTWKEWRTQHPDTDIYLGEPDDTPPDPLPPSKLHER